VFSRSLKIDGTKEYGDEWEAGVDGKGVERRRKEEEEREKENKRMKGVTQLHSRAGATVVTTVEGTRGHVPGG
jgi:hypothetical protein